MNLVAGEGMILYHRTPEALNTIFQVIKVRSEEKRREELDGSYQHI